ncbi:protein unc-45B-like [Tropilaelaps mercedesae]|uniref:Protein unc-45 homolog B n=1 Tax=Tropilaelaps mercedesae TaxID=418985 RepID=A0A1V9X1Y7_9ACAR|nr:protein unc-45B-like [Tropilaelaps mercedesae]
MATMSVQQLKDEGNKMFRETDYHGALEKYMEALKITDEGDSASKAILHNNRAMVYLKLERFKDAEKEATTALQFEPSNVKAFFRRAQALESQNKFDLAFKDARQVLHIDPKNTSVKPMLERLHARLQHISHEQGSNNVQVKKMLDIVKSESLPLDKKMTAANNLLFLAREKAALDIMLNQKGFHILYDEMKRLNNDEFNLVCVRIFGQICKAGPKESILVVRTLGLPYLFAYFRSTQAELIVSAQSMVQQIINSLSGMTLEHGKGDKAMIKKYSAEIDFVMVTLLRAVNSRVISGPGRDAILELITKNADYQALEWALKVVENDGIYRLLDVASELPEVKYESSMEVTNETKPKVSVCLDRLWYCMDHDAAKDKYRAAAKAFIEEKLYTGDELEPKVRATAAITVLLLGPLDCGNSVLAMSGVIEMMIAMASSDDELQQMVAAEALIAAASKKDKCTSILYGGTTILKKLYKSSNDKIRVRALVGLCKLGSFGGTDSSMRPFSDGASLKFADSCRRFLVNRNYDRDIRKWAAEGLSYLTLDADVKEDLIDDKPAIRALIEIAKDMKSTVLYGVVTTLCNLTNSYDKQEVLPELVKLAKFAKQHVPEEHPMDAKEYVDKRVRILAETGVTTALVALSKTDSKNSREIIARIFNAMCEQQDLRGIVVQQGGARCLIQLAQENTPKGKTIAAQALARVMITIDPQMTFSGRVIDAVKPLLELLDVNNTGLQNFEALLALTNLASIDNSVRTRIVKDGLGPIEHYLYEDHTQLRRAAAQCLLNLTQLEDVRKRLEIGDRIKMFALLLSVEDLDTRLAAAGVLFIILRYSEDACHKLALVKDWEDLVGTICLSDNMDLQQRGIGIIYSMVLNIRQLSYRMVNKESHLMQMCEALSKIGQLDDVTRTTIGVILSTVHLNTNTKK